MSADAQHAFEEHVGEVQLRVDAPGLPALFEEAGRALAELYLDAPAQPGAKPGPELPVGAGEESVAVRAADRDALLVEWLNELIFRSETRHRAYTSIRVGHVSEAELQAQIAGPAIEQPRVAVKAATLHGLCVAERQGRWTATVVLDV